MASAARKILLVTLEPVATHMAGPAIRCVELAKQLSREFTTTVFTPRQSDLSAADLSPEPNFAFYAALGKSEFYALAEQHEIIFVQGNVLKPYPRLAELGKHLVVDLYDPYLLAILAQFKEDRTSAAASYSLMHKVLEAHMSVADYAVCASERQRDYWLGRFCSLGRLTPEMYDFDPSFRKVIDVVPFGLPDNKPQKTGPAMKGKIPGIAQDDFVLLWGGGIWEWFDPLTVIEAVANVSKRNPRIKLYFMGYKSPNPQVPVMPMAKTAIELARKLDVLDKQVFFSDGWVSYDERVNYLLDADVAVSAHFDLPETRFSFRTRILDYLWAGLPILTTCGDQLADMIDAKPAGRALGYKDVAGWENAIEKLMSDSTLKQQYAQGSADLATQFYWSEVVKPLAQYCRNPHKLPGFKPVKMPSLFQRAQAVYSRGGKDLVLRRSKEILQDILKV